MNWRDRKYKEIRDFLVPYVVVFWALNIRTRVRSLAANLPTLGRRVAAAGTDFPEINPLRFEFRSKRYAVIYI